MAAQNETDENLKELFEELFGTEQSEAAVEDVREGEQILRTHPAPEPDDALIGGIKAEITRALLRREASVFRWASYKVAAVAAVFIILAVVGVRMLEKGGEPARVLTASIIPAAIWESEDIAADDAELAILTDEVEQIGSEVLAVQLGENGGNGHRDIAELEMELIEIDSDFWKG